MTKHSLILVLPAMLLLSATRAKPNTRPIAHAGSSRYVATDPIQLDGTGSHDPDASGPLTYAWTQTAGPAVVIVDANLATPTIAGAVQLGTRTNPGFTLKGFFQTDEVQACEFELIVSDGELMSAPNTVAVSIVPDFGTHTLHHENPPFDVSRPTVIYFAGGNCKTGGGPWGSAAWAEKANIISFPAYGPDRRTGDTQTYYRCGDLLIAFLSQVAPDYRQPIQTMGWSTGGQPAIDAGIHLNLSYQDARYAVNRVTLLDATPYCRSHYAESIRAFLDSSVDGEQCWIDNYVSTLPGPSIRPRPREHFFPDVLNVGAKVYSHSLALSWYDASLIEEDANLFNGGMVAGAYWSVVGPGKNLQLASSSGVQTYAFKWHGADSSGEMAFFDEIKYPGRLPQPVVLKGPVDVSDPNGLLFTCEGSENAVGYELLLGADPYDVRNYHVFSDTPTPPSETIGRLPFPETWWTVRVRDAHGSTIHADPRRVDLPLRPLLRLK